MARKPSNVATIRRPKAPKASDTTTDVAKAEATETNAVEITSAPQPAPLPESETYTEVPKGDDTAPAGVPEVPSEEQPEIPEEIGVIITVKAKVKERTRKLAAVYQELVPELIAQTASVMWHSAKHGDTSLLNSFFGIIPESQKQSFVEWVSGAVKAQYPEDVKLSNLWLGRNKEKGFFVRQRCQADRDAFLVVCERNAQENTEAFNWMKKRAASTRDPFGDDDIAKRLAGILRQATAENSVASPSQVKALQDAIALFDREAVVKTTDAKKAA